MPRALSRTAFASAVPACALVLANACGGQTTDDELSGAGDAKVDHIFQADVTAHFDANGDRNHPPPDDRDDASDSGSESDSDADADADATEEAG